MTIAAGIKVIDLPDDACLTTVRDLVLMLEKYLAVEIDASDITNVVVSSSEPDAGDRNVIWFKIDNSGNFVGIHVFVQGEWLQMFPPPSAIIRMYGNSTDVPEGYALIENGTAGFTSGMVAALQAQWHLETGGTFYDIFDVVYVGL